jgi:hypothetical protein
MPLTKSESDALLDMWRIHEGLEPRREPEIGFRLLNREYAARIAKRVKAASDALERYHSGVNSREFDPKLIHDDDSSVENKGV